MEHITTPKIESVRLLDRFNARKPAVGTLYLTTTHLIFVDPAGKKETWIMHMHVASIEKLSLTAAGAPIQIRCKTFQMATFVIPREKDCQELYKSLQKLSNPAQLEAVYAFHYKSSTFNNIYSGWNQMDLETEYARLGIPNEHWVPSNINKNYEICDTYPKLIHVPKTASAPILFGSARFRSRGRLPVLSYLHSNNAAMTRCSQPLAGFSARCMEDEQMLQAILRANPKSAFMYVVDTRPKINAMVNKASGKGYENTDFYSNIKFKFLGIENIHVMRASLQKLTEVCELKNPSMEAFLSGLGSSGWLKHIKAIVDTSLFIAKALTEEGVSVLVHCSDGWDRTAQTCSLSSMMLDPYYRTIQGFQVLIEKEWLAFGHKFLHRCGLIACDPREVSPIFTQFIDSVWQLTQQFPCQFQFNERFLLELHDHVFSCQFGNFLGNCEKGRVDLRVSERTYSLWAYMQTRMADYINPLYRPLLASKDPVLKPNTNPQAFRFWRGMYNRYENGVHPREPLMDILSAMKDHSSSLDDHVQYLESKVTSLRRMLGYEDKNKKYDDEKEKDETEHHGSREDSLSNHSVDSLENPPITKHSIPNSVDNKTVDELEKVANSSSSSMKDIVAGDTSISPLKIPGIKREDSGEIISASLTADAVESVAADWQSFRNIRQCVCSTPFDHFSRKYHCWKCGNVFCMRCIDKQTPLPGHFSQRPVPVCRPCYKDLKAGSSLPNSPTLSPAHIANMMIPPRLENLNLVN
ncbi:phosphatidylinositol-3,5-bisphosphate 3-phosphatase MTMR8-like isoform X2 [Amphiura filiformis]|uniref:phosphatidylinositol-3,5-bisphosphate 3-phosphatase MTMR8-like isoform X2 n=1 Tax=Amphiura filiformis TaxID=82378 RepID=UPI003B221BF1